MSWLLPRLRNGTARLGSFVQSLHMCRTGSDPLKWAAAGPESSRSGSLAACMCDRQLATDSSPADGDDLGVF